MILDCLHSLTKLPGNAQQCRCCRIAACWIPSVTTSAVPQSSPLSFSPRLHATHTCCFSDSGFHLPANTLALDSPLTCLLAPVYQNSITQNIRIGSFTTLQPLKINLCLTIHSSVVPSLSQVWAGLKSSE